MRRRAGRCVISGEVVGFSNKFENILLAWVMSLMSADKSYKVFFFCYDPRTISLARVGQCLSFVSHAIVSPVHSDRSNSTISQSLIFLKCSELGDWQVTGRRWVELSRIGLYERGFDAVSAAREADGWCLSTQTIIGGAAESSRQRSHLTDQESTVEHDCRQEGTAGQQTASCFFFLQWFDTVATGRQACEDNLQPMAD